MHIRESQNAIVGRAVKETLQQQRAEVRVSEAAARVSPAVSQAGANVLRCGVQNIEDAVLGK